MKTTEKVIFAVLGTMIFFISGGVACTYGGSGAHMATTESLNRR